MRMILAVAATLIATILSCDAEDLGMKPEDFVSGYNKVAVSLGSPFLITRQKCYGRPPTHVSCDVSLQEDSSKFYGNLTVGYDSGLVVSAAFNVDNMPELKSGTMGAYSQSLLILKTLVGLLSPNINAAERDLFASSMLNDAAQSGKDAERVAGPTQFALSTERSGVWYAARKAPTQ